MKYCSSFDFLQPFRNVKLTTHLGLGTWNTHFSDEDTGWGEKPCPPRPKGAERLGWMVPAKGTHPPLAPGTPALPLAAQLPRGQQGLRPRGTPLVGLTTTPSPPCQGQTMPNTGGQPGLRARDRGGWLAAQASFPRPSWVGCPVSCHSADAWPRFEGSAAHSGHTSPWLPGQAQFCSPTSDSPGDPCPPEGL